MHIDILFVDGDKGTPHDSTAQNYYGRTGTCSQARNEFSNGIVNSTDSLFTHELNTLVDTYSSFREKVLYNLFSDQPGFDRVWKYAVRSLTDFYQSLHTDYYNTLASGVDDTKSANSLIDQIRTKLAFKTNRLLAPQCGYAAHGLRSMYYLMERSGFINRKDNSIEFDLINTFDSKYYPQGFEYPKYGFWKILEDKLLHSGNTQNLTSVAA